MVQAACHGDWRSLGCRGRGFQSRPDLLARPEPQDPRLLRRGLALGVVGQRRPVTSRKPCLHRVRDVAPRAAARADSRTQLRAQVPRQGRHLRAPCHRWARCPEHLWAAGPSGSPGVCWAVHQPDLTSLPPRGAHVATARAPARHPLEGLTADRLPLVRQSRSLLLPAHSGNDGYNCAVESSSASPPQTAMSDLARKFIVVALWKHGEDALAKQVSSASDGQVSQISDRADDLLHSSRHPRRRFVGTKLRLSLAWAAVEILEGAPRELRRRRPRRGTPHLDAM